MGCPPGILCLTNNDIFFSTFKSMFLYLDLSKSISVSLSVFFCFPFSLSLPFVRVFLFALLIPLFSPFSPCCPLFYVRRGFASDARNQCREDAKSAMALYSYCGSIKTEMTQNSHCTVRTSDFPRARCKDNLVGTRAIFWEVFAISERKNFGI